MLPIARVKLGVSGSGDIASDSEQGPEGVERVESPVEAECELVEVGLEVLVAHAVMNATQLSADEVYGYAGGGTGQRLRLPLRDRPRESRCVDR